MVAVEVEEGEDFVACEIPEGKVGLDQCKSIMWKIGWDFFLF